MMELSDIVGPMIKGSFDDCYLFKDENQLF